MGQKQAKKLRKKLREGNVLDFVVKDGKGNPINQLMRRLDDNPESGQIDEKTGIAEPRKKFRGGAIYARDSLRGVYREMKKRQKQNA